MTTKTPISSLTDLRRRLACIPSRSDMLEIERLWRQGRCDEAVQLVERLVACDMPGGGSGGSGTHVRP